MLNIQTLRKTNLSETLLINELSKQKASDGESVYKFGFGQSPFLPPARVIQALQDHAYRKEYMSVQGDFLLRKTVADFHAYHDHIDTDPEYVLIGPGSKMLIYMVMAAFTQAEVLLITPSWVSYEPQAKLAGHPILRIHTRYEDRWRLLPQDLDKVCAQRSQKSMPLIMILNYPGNPDGLTYTADELQQIADVCRTHNILVISDEIYGLLHHEGAHVSLARFYPEGTIVTTGLSKWAGAGGWRLGVALVAKQLGKTFMQCLIGIASETYSTAAAPIQVAACTAYTYTHDINTYLTDQRMILKALGNEVYQRLKQVGIHVHAPEGGFYLNPDFVPFKNSLQKRGIINGTHLCEVLLKECGVALLPGCAFGYPLDSYVTRLAYVDFDGTQAMSALADTQSEVDLGFLQQYCGKVLEGIDILVHWIINMNAPSLHHRD